MMYGVVNTFTTRSDSGGSATGANSRCPALRLTALSGFPTRVGTVHFHSSFCQLRADCRSPIFGSLFTRHLLSNLSWRLLGATRPIKCRTDECSMSSFDLSGRLGAATGPIWAVERLERQGPAGSVDVDMIHACTIAASAIGSELDCVALARFVQQRAG